MFIQDGFFFFSSVYGQTLRERKPIAIRIKRKEMDNLAAKLRVHSAAKSNTKSERIELLNTDWPMISMSDRANPRILHQCRAILHSILDRRVRNIVASLEIRRSCGSARARLLFPSGFLFSLSRCRKVRGVPKRVREKREHRVARIAAISAVELVARSN